MRISMAHLTRIGKWSKKYANLPDRYINRAMNQVYWKNPKGIQYKPHAVIQRKKFNFGVHRPWTVEFRNENQPKTYSPKVFVEPIREWSFFRGDRVEVLVECDYQIWPPYYRKYSYLGQLEKVQQKFIRFLAFKMETLTDQDQLDFVSRFQIGKDKGKQGFIKTVIQERNWVLVEGLNCKLKNLGKDEKRDFEGVYVQEEQPLLVTTDITLVDPSDLKPTEYEWRFTEEGEKVRVSARTGRIIPLPASAEETIDYKSKRSYKEQPKDTPSGVVTEVTFEPKLCTFEMDIMDKMGIKEDRVPPKSYWY